MVYPVKAMASSTSSSLLNFLSPLFPSNTTSQSPTITPKFPNFTSNSPISPSLSISTPRKQQQQNDAIISQKKKEEEEYPSEIMGVVCPSLAFSNTLYYKSAYNVQVLVDENENEERLLNRFRREVMRAGVIQECKRRRYFENKQDEKKRKTREAAKRNSRRRRMQFRVPFENREETTEKVEKNEDDDDDNWEMPEGDAAPF